MGVVCSRCWKRKQPTDGVEIHHDGNTYIIRDPWFVLRGYEEWDVNRCSIGIRVENNYQVIDGEGSGGDFVWIPERNWKQVFGQTYPPHFG